MSIEAVPPLRLVGGQPSQEAVALAEFLQQLKGRQTVLQVADRVGDYGRSRWAEFLNGTSLIPLSALEQAVREFIKDPRRQQAALERGLDLLERALQADIDRLTLLDLRRRLGGQGQPGPTPEIQMLSKTRADVAQAQRQIQRGREGEYKAQRRRSRTPAAPVKPPPLVEDTAGQEGKPDPLEARSQEEFGAALRTFWRWTGEYSPRQLSTWSRETPYGSVSHTTLNNLLAEAPRKRPPMKLRYVQLIISCCGGDETEIQRWSTAWRRLHVASTPAAHEEEERSG